MPLLERGISSKAGRELGEEIASAHRRGESRFPNMPASPDQPSTCSKRRREIARNHGIEFLGIVGAGGYFFFLSLSLCFTCDLTTQFSDFSESFLQLSAKLLDLAFQFSHCFLQFRQVIENRHGAQPYLVLDPRRTGISRARGNIVRNRALRRQDCAVAHVQVSRACGLSSENAAVANNG